jgi:hypothetical protein
MGFSPRIRPRLIAVYPTHGAAIAISEGLDRDRAVDESGNQLAVFGRKGARPFNLEEQQKLYRKGDAIYKVNNEPQTAPVERRVQEPAPEPEPSTAPTRRRPGRR